MSHAEHTLGVNGTLILPENYPEVLATIAFEAYERLQKLGIEDAGDIAVSIAEAVRHSHGGTAMYIPLGDDFERAQRNREIWEKFNGTNMSDLAREYKMTERQMGEIVRGQRFAHKQRAQLSLID